MITLDIETIPLMASLAVPYSEADNPPPANYSKPEAIDGHHAKGRAAYATARVKACSLNPRLGRIVCLAMKRENDPATCLTAPNEGDEARLLLDFWEVLKREAFPQVGTWNGSFDLRFIVVRSLAHGILPTVAVAPWFRKYQYSPHFDAKMALLNWPSGYPSGEGLEEWSEFFGLPGKTDGMDGSQVYTRFLEGKLDEIAAYCIQDAEATAAIIDRISPMYL